MEQKREGVTSLFFSVSSWYFFLKDKGPLGRKVSKRALRKYTDFSELTTPMIYEFIDKTLVHAPDRSSGERTQEVDIYLKFIGKFDVPLPEPTPEELAEMEKVHQRRVYYREKARRAREKKKQQD